MPANESLVSHRKIVVASNRSFGLVFTVVFAIIGLWPVIRSGQPRAWAIVIAALFLAVTLLAPAWLAPLNRLWLRLGLLLHHIVNPIVMGLIFFCAVLPMSLVMRAFGRDALRRKREPDSVSYWIAREPPGPRPGSMSKQF